MKEPALDLDILTELQFAEVPMGEACAHVNVIGVDVRSALDSILHLDPGWNCFLTVSIA